MTRQTMLHYWEQLSQKDRRLIHDLLRYCNDGRRTLAIGLLPFVPVDEVVNLLRRNPSSPWTAHLYEEYFNDDRGYNDDILQRTKYKAYQKSSEHDRADYKRIIEILTVKPSKLAAELEKWQELTAGGRE